MTYHLPDGMHHIDADQCLTVSCRTLLQRGIRLIRDNRLNGCSGNPVLFSLFMLHDSSRWERIRARVLYQGETISAIAREEHLAPDTIRKIVATERPLAYTPKQPRQKRVYTPEQFKLLTNETDDGLRAWSPQPRAPDIANQLSATGFKGSSASVRYHLTQRSLAVSAADLALLRQALIARSNRECLRYINALFTQKLQQKIADLTCGTGLDHDVSRRLRWMAWLDSVERGDACAMEFVSEDVRCNLAPPKARNRKRALTVMANRAGFNNKEIAAFLHIGLSQVVESLKTFDAGGEPVLFAPQRYPKKSNDEALKEAVFALLHEPPSQYGLNRTSWRMVDLEAVLRSKGLSACYKVLQTILREGGGRWRRAKVVLTSKDPDYQAKLDKVMAIVGALKPTERFFSIDEYGPFYVRRMTGRRLSAPDDPPKVPQWQHGRGKLTMTAAVEISRNQVTHFYSENKNTSEMLKLIDVLVKQYADCEKLYLSWDAATWHKSNRLFERIEELNLLATETRLPKVEIVPLPSNAQFLNIIESVFSGMARAVIHNSDYPTLEAAQDAIDRYFADRNEHFRLSGERAGKKIWGLERTPVVFTASNNCKDPEAG
jgi:transposase